MKIILMGLLSLVAVGCGGGGDSTSCSYTQNGMLQSCVDYTGIIGANGQLDALNQSCTASSSASLMTKVLSGCPHAGSVGGCKQAQASVTATTWYYAGMTAAQVMAACMAPNTFVTP